MKGFLPMPLFRPTLLLSAAALVALAPDEAAACGGLFCSSAAPVVQNRERIVFVDHRDGTMSMLVEIQYVGAAQRFSWVLPVAGTPTLGVGSTPVLNVLDVQTATQFRTT